MYTVDRRDIVVALNVPQSSVGAPIPVVLAGEHDLFIAYLADNPGPDWDSTTTRPVTADSHEPVAVVAFERPYAHSFGPPNDEAFASHPLASRGLTPYAAVEVEESSWIRSLEKMNRVHDQNQKARFMIGKRHFIFAFHDQTFECVASGFAIEIHPGPMRAVTTALSARFD